MTDADRDQARLRLELATHATDHLLVTYGRGPGTRTGGEWLTMIAEQTRELIRAASDYLETKQAPGPEKPIPLRSKGVSGNSGPGGPFT